MNQKIGLCNIKIEWLNKRAIVLISIFASAANKIEGGSINLTDDDVLSKISYLAKTSGNAELLGLYKQIKHQIKISLSEANSCKDASQEVAKLSVYNRLSEAGKQQSHA